MRHPDGALEVRLRRDDGALHTLVGWLESFPQFDHRGEFVAINKITRIGRDGLQEDDDIIDSHSFRLTEMNRNVSYDDVIDGRVDLSDLARQLPIGVMREESKRSRYYIFTWKALVVGMANYELLFDLPDFEVNDNGEPDTDEDSIAARFAAGGGRIGAVEAVRTAAAIWTPMPPVSSLHHAASRRRAMDEAAAREALAALSTKGVLDELDRFGSHEFTGKGMASRASSYTSTKAR